MKDLSEETIAEVTSRLRSDEVSCNQFYHSFGLENPHPKKMFREIGNIGKLFPDTPIKLVRDVCRALQLFDLVELLEKALKPRTLRPALPLKEITKLLSYCNRPTTFYSNVKIVFVGDGKRTFIGIGNFFKRICPGGKISRSKLKLDLSQGQLRRNVLLARERESILLRIREIEQHEEEGRTIDAHVPELKIRLEKRKDEIDKLLQKNGELTRNEGKN